MAKGDFVSFSYIDVSGEDVKLGAGEVTAIKATFKDFDDETFELSELGDTVANASLAYGMQVKLQRGTAGKAVDKPDEAYDAVMSIWERAVGGDWVKEREAAGPRTSIVFDAVCRVLSAAGQEPDETKQTALREALKDKEAREKAMKDPRVEAAFLTIQAERTAERAAKAVAKAAAATATGEIEGLSF